MGSRYESLVTETEEQALMQLQEVDRGSAGKLEIGCVSQALVRGERVQYQHILSLDSLVEWVLDTQLGGAELVGGQQGIIGHPKYPRLPEEAV